MNFDDARTLEQALELAPPPRLHTTRDRAEHTAAQNRLLVAQEDERRMAEWRRLHPEDVVAEHQFWERRREDRRRRRELACQQCAIRDAGGRTIFTAEDDRWFDIWLSTSSDSNNEADDDGDDWSD